MPSRKRVLAGLAAVAATGLPYGCASPFRARRGSTGSPPPTAAEARDLAHFMALSAVLTGFGGLDATAGDAYLRNVRADAARSKALDALFEQSGIASQNPPSAIADLRRRGVFAEPASLAAASQILADWFSGTYAGPSGPVTATWSGALAWRACTFTKAPASCGGAMGYWAKPSA
ncbi:MAG: sugar dehydrogenase complex small subunit [Candidatus Baltobacteraceae bacterium]